MAFNVNLYAFAKKRNSTKQPVGTSTQLSGVAREPLDILAPVIQFELSSTPLAFNYAYIGALGRYYFIDNWQYEQGLWTATMTCDVMASHKSYIGAMTEYVLRATSGYNGHIVDTTYNTVESVNGNARGQQTGSGAIIISDCCNSWAHSFSASSGCYVVGISNTESSSTGVINGVCYYVMTATQFTALVNYLLTNTSYYGTITDISADLLKVISGPLDYIVSCKWFPYTVPATSSTVTVKVGWWTTNVSAKLLTSVYSEFPLAISLPVHPQAASRGVFLRQAPFTTYDLYVPSIGHIAIDATKVYRSGAIGGTLRVDHINGESSIELIAGAYTADSGGYTPYLGRYEGQAAVTIPLSSITGSYNIGGVINSAANSVTSAVESVANMGGGITNKYTPGAPKISSGLISAFFKSETGQEAAKETVKEAASIANVASAAFAQYNKTGEHGSFTTLAMYTTFTYGFTILADEDLTSRGRPVCENKTISTLSGFIQCADVEPALAVYSAESTMIKSFMENGFFYE